MGLDAALVGVPMDLGVTNRAGARLRTAGGARDRAHRPLPSRPRLAPLAELKVADIGDVPFRSRFSLDESHAGHRGLLSRSSWRRASRR